MDKQVNSDTTNYLRVAVDIGGTFTDFCVFDESTGLLSTLKTLSTPESPGTEVMNGLAVLQQRHGISSEQIKYFGHGTTVGVNTVIQRSGSQLALFTTKHFEDVLEVARLKVPDPYNIFSQRPAPLVARENVFGIAERTLKDASIERSVDRQEIRSATLAAQSRGVETIVVALLHSYANPENEQRVREIINATAPDISVTLSSDVWPVIREYERTVTATVAGYVQRRISDYISLLQSALSSSKVPAELMITKSNGGIMSAELGKTDPLATLLSGTASGVIGASDIASRTGFNSVLSFDVGGTSADVAVIQQGKASFGSGELVGEFPIYVPTVSVTSIGEGGGSIAWVDDLGVLKVGPESAGSTPGPACYGAGGVRATITDAFAVLGLLGAGNLGYGTVSIDRAAATNALKPIAERLNCSVTEAADNIISVSISGMYLEVSKLLSRHGVDPREFALLAFGGAGPMTACLLAKDIGLRSVIVPPTPGVLSAYGGLIADIRNDFISTVFTDLDEQGMSVLARVADELANKATHWLRREQSFQGTSTLHFTADMRYLGQSYEIETALSLADLQEHNAQAIAECFHDEHSRVYGHSDNDAPVQVVNLRVVVTGTVPKPDITKKAVHSRVATAQSTADIFLNGKQQTASIYKRAKLLGGDTFSGPAIVLQDDCTTIVPAGFTTTVDAWNNLVVESKE